MQRVVGGGAPPCEPVSKERLDEEKGQEGRHEKGRKEEVAAGDKVLEKGVPTRSGRLFYFGKTVGRNLVTGEIFFMCGADGQVGAAFTLIRRWPGRKKAGTNLGSDFLNGFLRFIELF